MTENNTGWVRIPNFPAYTISKEGNVKNIKTGRILKPYVNSKGYFQVDIKDSEGKRKEMLVHRLVALCFLSNPHDLPVVNHIDEDKMNNNLTNLEWVTHKDNCNHGTRNQRMSYAKKKEVRVIDSKGYVKEVIRGIQEIVKKYNISLNLLRKSMKGEIDLISKGKSNFNFKLSKS